MHLCFGMFLVATVLGCNGSRASTSTARSAPAPSSAAVVVPDAAVATTASAVAHPDAWGHVVRAGAPRGVLANTARALDGFRDGWDQGILPNPVAGSYTSDVHGKRASAHVVACREGYLRAKDTIGPTEGHLVLFSALSALDRAGDCWEVKVPTGRFNEILGYLDPETGALVFVWLVPEG